MTYPNNIILSIQLTEEEVKILVNSYEASSSIVPGYENNSTPLGKIIDQAREYCIIETGNIVTWSQMDSNIKFQVTEIVEEKATLQMVGSDTLLVVDITEIIFYSTTTNNSEANPNNYKVVTSIFDKMNKIPVAFDLDPTGVEYVLYGDSRKDIDVLEQQENLLNKIADNLIKG